jgi:hypothetical protein
VYDSETKCQECNLVESKETESSESGNAKITDEIDVDCIFYAKCIIHHKFMPGKRTVNGKFYNEMIKKLIARVHCIRPEFEENGSWYLLHDSAEFLAKQGIPMLSYPPYSPDL